MAALRSLKFLLVTICITRTYADEQTVALAGEKYRIQALSSTLVRVELEGPLGFLDNHTNLVANRSAFAGVPLAVETEFVLGALLVVGGWRLTYAMGLPLP